MRLRCARPGHAGLTDTAAAVMRRHRPHVVRHQLQPPGVPEGACSGTGSPTTTSAGAARATSRSTRTSRPSTTAIGDKQARPGDRPAGSPSSRPRRPTSPCASSTMTAVLNEASDQIEDLFPLLRELRTTPLPEHGERDARAGRAAQARPARSRTGDGVCYALAHGHPGGTRMSGAPAPRTLPTAPRSRALQKRLLDWYAENRRDLPWRRTTDPYAVLVSEIMLQQTQVPARRAAVHRLAGGLARPREPRRRAARRRAAALAGSRLQQPGAAPAGAARRRPWPPRRRGRHAELPRTPEGLRALPGIGPYTARAVLVFAHNADLAAVDANVRRVLTHELGLSRGPRGDRSSSRSPTPCCRAAAAATGTTRSWTTARWC